MDERHYIPKATARLSIYRKKTWTTIKETRDYKMDTIVMLKGHLLA